MSEITQTPAVPLTLRAESAAGGFRPPTQHELMAELGIKSRPGWTSRLPSGLASFVTNGKGMAGVIILLALILTAVFAPLLTEYNPTRRAGKPHVQPSYEHVIGTTRMGKDVFT